MILPFSIISTRRALDERRKSIERIRTVEVEFPKVIYPLSDATKEFVRTKSWANVLFESLREPSRDDLERDARMFAKIASGASLIFVLALILFLATSSTWSRNVSIIAGLIFAIQGWYAVSCALTVRFPSRY